MSLPKNLESYPDWMLRLAGEFEQGTRRRVLQFDSPEYAKRVRRQIYGFRDAIFKNNMFKDYPNFQTIRVQVIGNDVHVLHVDEFIPTPKEYQQ